MKAIISQINGFFAENISGMRIVQAFNRQFNKLKEFRELNNAYFKTTTTQVFLNSFLRPTMEVINNLVIALLIVYGMGRITGGYLEVGVLYAFTNYVKQFFEPINDLAEKYTDHSVGTGFYRSNLRDSGRNGPGRPGGWNAWRTGARNGRI